MANKRNKWKNLYAHRITFVCPYCHQVFPIKDMTKNFVPPISRQKNLGPSKIVPACRTCNQEKGALSNHEYKQWKSPRDYLAWVRLEHIRNGHIK